MRFAAAMEFDCYVLIHCFRISNHRLEKQIVAAACQLGGFPKYRQDRVDIFIPEGPELTCFLLQHQDSLERLEFLEYRVAKYTK